LPARNPLWVSATFASIIIHEAFDSWKGELKQVDDVCVVGIRIG
jgi:hypothetical protein